MKTLLFVFPGLDWGVEGGSRIGELKAEVE
jgi:hypothetical protein